MGAHSTLRITRGAARRYVLGKLLTMSDADLVRMLDSELFYRLYNARLVDDDEENDDDVL